MITRVERIIEDGDHGLPTGLQRIRRESVGSEAAKYQKQREWQPNGFVWGIGVIKVRGRQTKAFRTTPLCEVALASPRN